MSYPAAALPVGVRHRRTPDPCAVVIFGATGDLTQRMLMPSLFRLARLGRIAHNCAVVAYARRPKTDEVFRNEMARAVLGPSPSQADRTAWDAFAPAISYVQAEFEEPDGYVRLGRELERLDRERGTESNRVFYLATAPGYYEQIIEGLRDHALITRAEAGAVRPWSRIVVEKPFGRDLASAQALNHTLTSAFNENQIYRIDHYLGKETVQNILVFRFANGIFEPIWNQHFIDHVQITVAEAVGVEGRAGFYETAGVVRDIIQNHMLQLLALVAMEAPAVFEADEVREEKVKVLRSLRRYTPDDVDRYVIFGQYGPGQLGGVDVPGYVNERRVAPDSRTPTYAAMRLFLDNWRWAGVPFYVRSGKRMPRRVTEITVQFKQPPLRLFRHGGRQPNLLTLNIQPDEGISLTCIAKSPGSMMTLHPVEMGFAYEKAFEGAEALSAYERLLLDCMIGDPTLFTRRDEVEEAWEFLQLPLTHWDTSTERPHAYPAGTWGPDAARVLLERDGRHWRPS